VVGLSFVVAVVGVLFVVAVAVSFVVVVRTWAAGAMALVVGRARVMRVRGWGLAGSAWGVERRGERRGSYGAVSSRARVMAVRRWGLARPAW